MVSNPILTRFELVSHLWQPEQCNFHSAFLNPEKLLRFVQEYLPAMQILGLLGPPAKNSALRLENPNFNTLN